MPTYKTTYWSTYAESHQPAFPATEWATQCPAIATTVSTTLKSTHSKPYYPADGSTFSSALGTALAYSDHAAYFAAIETAI